MNAAALGDEPGDAGTIFMLMTVALLLYHVMYS